MSESTHSKASPSAAGQPDVAVGGVRGASRATLPPLLILYLGLGVVQVFLAGLGVFALDGERLGGADETAFGSHRFVGTLMGVVALLIVIAASIARPGRRIVIMALVLFLMLFLFVSVVQTVLAVAGEDTAVFGGLHALVGIGSLGPAGQLLAVTRSRS